MDNADNLNSLMARYQAGDCAAVTALVESVGPQLHRFFMAQSASRGDADDLLQETWLRIHRVRHTYRPSEPALPWFYAIARRVRIDHYRRASRTTALERPLEEMSDAEARAFAGGGSMGGAGNAPGTAFGKPTRDSSNDESGGNVVGRGRAGHLLQRWVGQAESASCLPES